MKRREIILFVLFTILFLPRLEALKRAYFPNYEKLFDSLGDIEFCDNETYYFCAEHCYLQLKKRPSKILNFIHIIPEKGSCCTFCLGSSSIYLGYVDRIFKKYSVHLIHHLEYYNQHPDCNCLWPEISLEAAQINDIAYSLFQDLISTTALSNLLKSKDAQHELLNQSQFLNSHGLTISFIAQQFRFSDYYHVCHDIENYAMANYEETEVAKINDKLQDILEVLYSKFFALYTSCYAKHPNPDIDQEIRFMKLLVNDIMGL